MGAKESKQAEEPLVAYYESTLRKDLLGKIKLELKDKFNVDLQPLTQEVKGPALVIRDGTNDDMLLLQDMSRTYPTDRLMVVMVRDVVTHDRLDSSRLVQLKWSMDFTGKQQQSAVKTIMDFIKPPGDPDIPSTLDDHDKIPTAAADSRHVPKEAKKKSLAAGPARTDPGMDIPDYLLKEMSKVTVHADGSRSPVVSFAYGQDMKEPLLEKAVSFVQDRCEVTLQEARHVSDSPLLVFCKTEHGLVNDIRTAVGKTRKNYDVMLLVVTDKPDLSLDILDDKEDTAGFGAKDRLLWSHPRDKFVGRDNQKAAAWIQHFLDECGIDVPLRRNNSWRQSWRNFSTKPLSGVYYPMQPVKDEEVKHAVVFFDEHLIKLRKTHCLDVSPVVVFCSAGDSLRSSLDTCECLPANSVLVVVLHGPFQTSSLHNLPPFARKLQLSDNGREVPETAYNKKVPAFVRNFLSSHAKRKSQTDGLPEHGEREDGAATETQQADVGSRTTQVEAGCFGR